MKKRKKILIVADYFYPHWTGIAKSMYYFIQGIHKYYDLTVLTVRHDKNLKKKDKIFSANIIREDYIFSFSRSKYSLALIIKLFISVRNFDVVIINSPSSNILFASLIAKIFRKKIIIIHHGDLILPRGIINRFIEKIFDLSTYLALLNADKITCFTMDYARNSRILKRFLKKCHELIFPVYIKEKLVDKIEILKDLKNEKIIIGFAGRFVEEKGFDMLIDSMKLVKDEIPNVIFVFAGETNISYENFYKKCYEKIRVNKEYLIFLGLLNSETLISFYKSLDFIVLPSRSDCFPLVQAEAMLCGIPAIVTDIPGLRFLVKKTEFGLIVDRGDQKLLAKKIVDAIRARNKIMIKYIEVKKVLDNNKNVEEIRRFIEQ
jgi:glycosyltransferase involved in cell wall biosynthesis